MSLLRVGAVHIAQALVPMAAMTGFDVVVIDPRRAFAADYRFPNVTVLGDWPDEAMERLQHAFPDAKFVKAFNSVGSALMVNPAFPGGARPTMFYCGDDAAAKATVATIIDPFGWEGADMGTAKAARAIEPLAQLWCIPGFRENKWTAHAFHLMQK